jgi:hypothetical protein
MLGNTEGQSKMENPKKLATVGTQDEEKTPKKIRICVGHNYMQTNTNNVNIKNESSYKQPEVKTNRTFLYKPESLYNHC